MMKALLSGSSFLVKTVAIILIVSVHLVNIAALANHFPWGDLDDLHFDGNISLTLLQSVVFYVLFHFMMQFTLCSLRQGLPDMP